jgi:predicted MFS family arabinose efflux permease
MVSIRIADPMLPAMARDFGTRPSDVAAAITFFALAYGIMQLIWGPLGDRLGKLRVIGWTAVASTVGSLLCAIAPSLLTLELARLVTGGCCAAIIPMSIAYIGDTVEYAHRQAALARFATGTLTGMIAGQVLGGLAADTVGWRVAFAVIAAAFLITGIAVLRMLARLEASLPPHAARASNLGAIWRSYAAVCTPPFSKWILATALLEGAIMFGPMAFIPSWLHQDTGLSLSASGLAVACIGLGGLGFTLGARHWVAQLGQRRLLLIGALCILAGFSALTFTVWLAPRTLVAVLAALSCLLAGFGFYMLHNTLQTLASQMSAESRATAVGLFAVAIFLGQSTGVSTVATIGPIIGFSPVFLAAGIAMLMLAVMLGTRLPREPDASSGAHPLDRNPS